MVTFLYFTTMKMSKERDMERGGSIRKDQKTTPAIPACLSASSKAVVCLFPRLCKLDCWCVTGTKTVCSAGPSLRVKPYRDAQ